MLYRKMENGLACYLLSASYEEVRSFQHRLFSKEGNH